MHLGLSRQQGFSLIEVLVAGAVACFLAMVMATLIQEALANHSVVRADADLVAFRSDLVLRLLSGRNCRIALGVGVQSINPTVGASTSINIYSQLIPSSVVFMYGTPTADQNFYGQTWRMTSVQLNIVGLGQAMLEDRQIALGHVVVNGVPTSPYVRPAVERIPVKLEIGLTNPAPIFDCHSTDPAPGGGGGGGFAAPDCVPGEVLTFGPPSPGEAAQWYCRTL